MDHAKIEEELRQALRAILEIAYAGHPDGRETRLAMIERYAKAALAEKKS
jgi:hypothetical protein